MSRERRFAFRLASVLALAALIVFAVVELQPGQARESLCDQASTLGSARLLAKAERTVLRAEADGETCDAGERRRIHGELTRAQKSFTAAAAFAAAGLVRQSPAKGKEGSEGSGIGGARAIVKHRAKLTNTRRAVDRYVAGLELYPFDAAARKALREQMRALPAPLSTRTGFARCRLGQRLAGAGLPNIAAPTVPQGLDFAHARCARTLRAINAQRSRAATLTLAAQRLAARDGDGEAVRKRYAAALLANAEEAKARGGLEASLDGDSFLEEAGEWLGDVPGALKEALPWIATLAVGLLLAALLGWIAVRQMAAHSAGARRLFRDAGRVYGLSFLAKAATPEVKVTSFDGDDTGIKGADFAALLEAGLATQAGREPFAFDRLSRGRNPDKDGPSVAKLLAEVPETKLLGNVLAAIGKLFRRRSIAIGGRLIPNADDGAGVLLKLEGNGRAVGEDITLWERAFDPVPGGDGAARRLRLVPAATVWVRWHVAAAQALPERLDVRLWQADALFKTAVAWQTMGDLRRAEALYAEALEKDPSLLPAAHNLAVIDIHDGRYPLALRRLTAMRDKLEADEELAEAWPTLGTASLYTLALALAYPALDGDPEQETAREQLGEAVRRARALLDRLASLPAPDRGGEAGPGGKEEPSFEERLELESAIGPSLILLAGLTVRQLPHERTPAIEAARREGAGIGQVEREDLAGAVGASRPWELIYSFLLQQPNVSRRSYYNLACYYTSLARFAGEEDRDACLGLALKALETAVVGNYLVDWAGKDPSLRPLAEDPLLGKQFAAVLKAHAVPPHADASKVSDDAKKNGDGDGKDKGLLDIAQLSVAWARRQI